MAIDDEPRPRRKIKKARARRDAAPGATPRGGEDPADARAEVPAGGTLRREGVPPTDALDDPAARAVRRQLLGSGAAAALGVALVGTGPSELGMWIALAGGVGLVWSIHRLGRLGPPGLPTDPAPRRAPGDGR